MVRANETFFLLETNDNDNNFWEGWDIKVEKT